MLCDLSFSVIRAKKAWKGLAFIIVLRLWRIFRVVISKYSFFQLSSSCYSRKLSFNGLKIRFIETSVGPVFNGPSQYRMVSVKFLARSLCGQESGEALSNI